MPESLLIRADGNAHIGTGHIMRCLALAQAWQRAGGNVVFAMAESTSALNQRLGSEGFDLIRLQTAPGSSDDAKQTSSLARQQNASWVVNDGYHFDMFYQERIKDAGQRLLVLDDFGHAKRYCADFVLNQNLGAREDLYPLRRAQTKLLLGTRYCLLRREFLKRRNWQRKIPARATKILITLGGADPQNVTGKVIEAVRLLGDVEAIVAVGGSNPNLDSLKTLSSGGRTPIRLVVDALDMPDLMAAADFAITAGGTTLWELAFMGLPALVIVLAENQRSNGGEVQRLGVAQNLGWHADFSPDVIARAMSDLLNTPAARNEMSLRGRSLVDGLGSFRVWLHLNEHTLGLRPAAESDSRVIWEWANQPAVRDVSFASDPIPWASHARWFREKLSDRNCHFWLATNGGQKPVGQVRFDRSEHEATISVCLDSARCGQGLGSLLIWAACRKLFHETSAGLVHAYIKPDNRNSIRAFEKAGFAMAGETQVRGSAAQDWQLTRAMAEP